MWNLDESKAKQSFGIKQGLSGRIWDGSVYICVLRSTDFKYLKIQSYPAIENLRLTMTCKKPEADAFQLKKGQGTTAL